MPVSDGHRNEPQFVLIASARVSTARAWIFAMQSRISPSSSPTMVIQSPVACDSANSQLSAMLRRPGVLT